MELQEGIFSAKLCELEKEYGLLQSRLQVCQGKDASQLHGILEQLRDESRAQELLLQQRVKGCRMRSVAELARAQLGCKRQMDALLPAVLEKEMRGKTATAEEDQAEANSLFAEYAIDFATLAMRYALCSAMQALELQMRAEEKAINRQGV